MKSVGLFTLAAACLASAKNILLADDDGWASTGIRATYRDLTAAGHNVYLVAPLEQRSGYGGTFFFPDSLTLHHDDQFGYKKAGDPSWGHEEFDDHIWYFNGTPHACISFAFDWLLPRYFANVSIDLVVSGPNQGPNAGSLYTMSGTMGAVYNSVNRGYPGIAFSGSNFNNTFFKDLLNDDPLNIWNIYSKKVVEFVDTLFASQGDNPLLLPKGTGLDVNMPLVAADSKTGCVDPKFVYARMSGAETKTPGLKYNETTGLFSYGYVPAPGMNVEYNGDLSLPSEDIVMNHGDCVSDVALFSIDYTAPEEQQKQVQGMLQSLLVEM
ncbi:CYFA0S10e04126g1_1 [Cyberlindnera fabianii]|uniref:Acid phosphatase n=1 Tax=Cyberlindnera fabianii TaxID=36022 RepID=A0A061AZ50_CYBFA|nr:Acid phosphatase [Cyberlindnera fabianii]CDR42946.1 CYFA0S10e04126g1_1 [Cyberlindnera fabianii]